MAVKVKLDKDTILEFLDTRKDQIFIVLLLALFLGGGWFLYQKSALSVGDIINEAIKNPTGRAGAETTKTVTPDDVVTSLVEKRPQTLYDIKRNPFGSPEEQLRLRNEVQQTYNRAVELFNAGEYETAIQQFEKVIALDVTETRISYPVMPSEYKRRAQREFLKNNFQSMYTSAENDINEGNRFLSANQMQQAEQVFARANKTLSDAIAADTDGSAIGKENLDKIQKMQQDVFQKWQSIQTAMLKTEIQKGTSQAQQLLGQNDLIALLKSMIQLKKVQEELNVVDPNFALIKQEERQPLINLVATIQNRLKEGYAELVTQAEAQFDQSLSAKDLLKTKEAIQVMGLALSINPQDKNVQQKLAALVVKRSQLVIELTTQFIAQQKDILDKKQYDSFDQEGKVKFLDELIALRALGGNALNADQKTQIANLENTLKTTIRKPPLVTEEFEILSIAKSTAADTWNISVRDKKSRTGGRTYNLRLKVGGPEDTNTKISLTQVDTAGGFVILSKPDCSPAKVDINQSK